MTAPAMIEDRSPESLPETFPHLLRRAAATRPDHPALVDGDRMLTYAGFWDRVVHAAAAFARAGLAPGDRVGVWLPNSLDWAVASLGAQAAGATIIPLNTRYKGPEIAHAMNRSGARFLVHIDHFMGNDYRAIADSADLTDVRTLAVEADRLDSDDWSRFIASGAQDPAALDEILQRIDALRGTDVSDIMFTSGTTGAPKGVVTTHGQNVRVYAEWVKATTLGPDDRYLLIWPFSHCSGYKSGLVSAMIAGCTLYPEPSLDIDRMVERAVRDRITFFPGPPTVFQALLDAIARGKSKIPPLRVVGTGGTMIDPALIRAIKTVLGAEVVYTGYGLTETCGTATMVTGNDPAEIVIHSSGRALPGIELAARNADGMILDSGEEGEIVTRGYHVMQGYLDDPAATAETIDANGWLHTGDLGLVDVDGYIRITGRAKDMYIVGGFNCYPAEIEHMLQSHPAVLDVAVIGVPDERLGEVGRAFIVWNAAQGEPDDTAIIGWSRENMANYKVPRSIVFLDALPRNATGKVEKFKLQ